MVESWLTIYGHESTDDDDDKDFVGSCGKWLQFV